MSNTINIEKFKELKTLTKSIVGTQQCANLAGVSPSTIRRVRKSNTFQDFKAQLISERGPAYATRRTVITEPVKKSGFWSKVARFLDIKISDQEGGAGAGVLAVIGLIFLFVVVIPLLGAALGIINLPFLKLNSKVGLNQGVITKTYETDYCLGNYEWFKNTYQDIQQTGEKITNIQDQITQFKSDFPDSSKWGFEQQTQYNTLTSQLTGTKNYKADITGQYNSRATQLHRVACKELPLFVNP